MFSRFSDTAFFSVWLAFLASVLPWWQAQQRHIVAMRQSTPGKANAQISWQAPRSPVEWKNVNAKIFQIYKDGNTQEILRAEKVLGKALLRQEPGYYLASICIARALADAGEHALSLSYYEKALLLDYRDYNLRNYFRSVRHVGMNKRAEKYLEVLKRAHPRRVASISANAASLQFMGLVAAGDEAYWKNDVKHAQMNYQKAAQLVKQMPVNRRAQSLWIDRFRRLWHEYRYFKLYDTPDGMIRYNNIVQPFLEQKLLLSSQDLPHAADATVFKVAAVIVRKTDLTYPDAKKRRVREKQLLDERELQQYKRAWRFASDAIQWHSKGRFHVKTAWVDLPQVTLTGLTENRWKNLVDVRHLDPAKLVPRQDALFENLTARFDAVIFVWDRGKAAKAYGGGPISLPHAKKRLPYRACVRSLPPEARGCMHELLHNFEGRGLIARVHGNLTKSSKTADFRGDDEVDWYCYLVSKVKDWRAMKFLR